MSPRRLFGGGFQSLLVFAYDVLGDRAPLPAEQLFAYRGSLYGFLAVRLEDYAFHARPISLAWDTVAMPTAPFRQLAVPIETLLSDAYVKSRRAMIHSDRAWPEMPPCGEIVGFDGRRAPTPPDCARLPPPSAGSRVRARSTPPHRRPAAHRRAT